MRLGFSILMTIALFGCKPEDDKQGNPVAENCGFDNSPGNSIGIGKYCEESSDCPAVAEGAVLQCSTVLVDGTLPLMCSRPCDITAADPGCGENAVCHNVKELGYDLNVCVSLSCQPLFSEPLM